MVIFQKNIYLQKKNTLIEEERGGVFLKGKEILCNAGKEVGL